MNISLKKLIIHSCFFTFSVFLFNRNTFAEQISSFTSDIKINKDGTVGIEETIVYDTQGLQKHGIVRDLDFKRVNQDNKTYIINIEIIKITDENDVPYSFSKSIVGKYLEVKIGDADKFISGVKTYVINYKMSGALTYFSDHDEFYWDLIGFGTKFPIKDFKASINLPDNTSSGSIKTICYEGIEGSTSQSCRLNNLSGEISVASSRILNPGENISVVVSFPKNIVAVLEPREDKSSIIQKIIWSILGFFASIWYFFLPLKILLNSIKEKNFLKKNERIVSAWFEPPKYDDKEVFSPAETGFIIDKSIDHKELTATIIHLAQKGFLKIKEDGKNHFKFIRLRDIESPELKNFEQQVMGAIFKDGLDIGDLDQVTMNSVNKTLSKIEGINKVLKIPQLALISSKMKSFSSDVKDEVSDRDLKNSKTLFTKISKFNKYVENEVVEQKMFEKKPSEIFAKNMILFGVGLTTLNLPLAIISLLFRRCGAKLTLQGIEKYSEAKSLLNFLKSQNDQLNFQSQNQMFFEKLLPYATAFGVEKIWANKFKDISMAKPDWYDGDNFTNSVFIGNMTRNIGGTVRSAHSSSMSSTRSSSGFSSGFSGGSSGGGGGGGGVGSW